MRWNQSMPDQRMYIHLIVEFNYLNLEENMSPLNVCHTRFTNPMVRYATSPSLHPLSPGPLYYFHPLVTHQIAFPWSFLLWSQLDQRSCWLVCQLREISKPMGNTLVKLLWVCDLIQFESWFVCKSVALLAQTMKWQHALEEGLGNRNSYFRIYHAMGKRNPKNETALDGRYVIFWKVL